MRRADQIMENHVRQLYNNMKPSVIQFELPDRHVGRRTASVRFAFPNLYQLTIVTEPRKKRRGTGVSPFLLLRYLALYSLDQPVHAP